MALWVLSKFVKKVPRSSFINLFVPVRVSCEAYALSRAGGDKIGTYLQACNHLMKSSETNANIAKATYEICKLRKMKIPNESMAQFADGGLSSQSGL